MSRVNLERQPQNLLFAFSQKRLAHLWSFRGRKKQKQTKPQQTIENISAFVAHRTDGQTSRAEMKPAFSWVQRGCRHELTVEWLWEPGKVLLLFCFPEESADSDDLISGLNWVFLELLGKITLALVCHILRVNAWQESWCLGYSVYLVSRYVNKAKTFFYYEFKNAKWPWLMVSYVFYLYPIIETRQDEVFLFNWFFLILVFCVW